MVLFSLDCSYKKNDFRPWYLTKFHPGHTSFTLTFTLDNLICLPWLQLSLASLIHKSLFPVLSNSLLVLQIYMSNCSLYTSYCCPALNLHMLKNQTPISHTSFYRDRRDLCHSFLSLCQKPQSFFDWTFTSYLWVITNSFWFYHFSSQGFSSLSLSIPETADLFQALILSLLEYCNNFFAFKLSFLNLLSILLPKWDFLTNLTTSLLFP